MSYPPGRGGAAAPRACKGVQLVQLPDHKAVDAPKANVVSPSHVATVANLQIHCREEQINNISHLESAVIGEMTSQMASESSPQRGACCCLGARERWKAGWVPFDRQSGGCGDTKSRKAVRSQTIDPGGRDDLVASFVHASKGHVIILLCDVGEGDTQTVSLQLCITS